MAMRVAGVSGPPARNDPRDPAVEVRMGLVDTSVGDGDDLTLAFQRKRQAKVPLRVGDSGEASGEVVVQAGREVTLAPLNLVAIHHLLYFSLAGGQQDAEAVLSLEGTGDPLRIEPLNEGRYVLFPVEKD